MPITKCKRVGRYSWDKIRPVCVEFQHRLDVEYFYANRRWTRRGFFIDKAYTQDVEHKRHLLRPILKAARRLPEYKGLCRLDCDELVLKGKHYTVDRLDWLPSNLNVFNLSCKENEDTVGFFGELNPLSNFHPANFIVNGIHYTSSEQFIQHMKALAFNDYTTAKKSSMQQTHWNARSYPAKSSISRKQPGKRLPKQNVNPEYSKNSVKIVASVMSLSTVLATNK